MRSVIGRSAIQARRSSSSAAATRSKACRTATITRASPISRPPTAAATSVRSAVDRSDRGTISSGIVPVRPSGGLEPLVLAKTLVERIAGAAHGADRINLTAAVERLAQAADMHVDGALVRSEEHTSELQSREN